MTKVCLVRLGSAEAYPKEKVPEEIYGRYQKISISSCNRSVPLIGKGEKFFEKMKKNGLGGATFFE
ncbi:MAG: hypothetical protein ACOZF2_18025 [Thermodesulfobacteriota bacterium]